MRDDKIISELYKDIVEKRNMCKIKLDDLITEIEIVKKSIEYRSSVEDDTRFFSPRNIDNGIETSEDLSDKLEGYEKLCDDTKKEFEYYDHYCTGLANYLNEQTDDSDVNDSKVDIKTYNLNLNYDYNDIKDKLLSIKSMTDLCIKIFDNDAERTRQEIKKINKSLKNLISSL